MKHAAICCLVLALALAGSTTVAACRSYPALDRWSCCVPRIYAKFLRAYGATSRSLSE
jgi:hypothetical protein